jgi:enamidase
VSPKRNTRHIKNIETLVAGDLDNPVRQADSIYIADGLIREIGNGLPHPAEVVIDARGLTAIPGLIDSHSHPTLCGLLPVPGQSCREGPCGPGGSPSPALCTR